MNTITTNSNNSHNLASEITPQQYTKTLINSILDGKSILSSTTNKIPSFIKQNIIKITSIIDNKNIVKEIQVLKQQDLSELQLENFKQLEDTLLINKSILHGLIDCKKAV